LESGNQHSSLSDPRRTSTGRRRDVHVIPIRDVEIEVKYELPRGKEDKESGYSQRASVTVTAEGESHQVTASPDNVAQPGGALRAWSAWMLVGVLVGVYLEQILCLGNCEEPVRGLRWVPQDQ
jgi:hypothetical protein